MAERPPPLLPICSPMFGPAPWAPSTFPTESGRWETVANWASYLPSQIVMPHPSPRNRHWLTKNPWFEAEALPAIQRRVTELLQTGRGSGQR